MITVNGITCFLILKGAITDKALNNYNSFIEINPDEPAIYGHLVDGHIETIKSNNTNVFEIQIAY